MMVKQKLVVVALLISMYGCTAVPHEPAGVMNWQRTELGFGFGMKDGSEITEQQWQAFVEREMTPRFPNGLSVVETHGQWRGPDHKIVKEKSRMVVILHPDSQADELKIEAIRAAFIKHFQQDAVMRVDEPVKVRF